MVYNGYITGWNLMFMTWNTGWWYTYPSEKWWSSSVGMMTFHSQNDGKVIKFHGSKAPTSHQSPQIHTNSPRCLGCPILKWPSPWQGTLCHNQGAVLGLFGTCLARWTLVVPWLFSGGIMDVLWMFYGCFMDVLWMCYGCVHGKYGCYGKSK